jgi:hypothetical protein
MDEKQHVVRHQPTRRPHLGGEKVGCHEHVHVRANELRPRGSRLAFGGWRNAVALQNVADALVTDDVT